MKGLVSEASDAVKEIKRGSVLDAALIASAQRMKHLEIASYGTVTALAEALQQEEIHQILTETLREETEVERRFTEIARGLHREAVTSSVEKNGGKHQLKVPNKAEVKPSRKRNVKVKATSTPSRER